MPVAPAPIAIELDPPPSSNIPCFAPRSASFCRMRRGEMLSPTARNRSFRSSSMATAVRESGLRSLPGQTLPSCNQTAWPPIPHLARASSVWRRRFRWPQMRRQVGVEPQQVGVLPHMADHPVSDRRFDALGQVARQPKPPDRVRCEHHSIDGDRQMFPIHYAAQSRTDDIASLARQRLGPRE